MSTATENLKFLRMPSFPGYYDSNRKLPARTSDDRATASIAHVSHCTAALGSLDTPMKRARTPVPASVPCSVYGTRNCPQTKFYGRKWAKMVKFYIITAIAFSASSAAADLFNDPTLLEETVKKATVFERQFEVLIDPSTDFCFSMELEPGEGHKLQLEYSVIEYYPLEKANTVVNRPLTHFQMCGRNPC